MGDAEASAVGASRSPVRAFVARGLFRRSFLELGNDPVCLNRMGRHCGLPSCCHGLGILQRLEGDREVAKLTSLSNNGCIKEVEPGGHALNRREEGVIGGRHDEEYAPEATLNQSP